MKQNTKRAGTRGEKDVVRSVKCPNCGKLLQPLPPNYPLFDVQCSGCSFRAQVKTNQSKPKDVVFGAGWDVMEKVLRSGYLVPPLIANFKWTEEGKGRQKVLFYPFVPKTNLRKYQLSPDARQAKYKMFNYTGLKTLPHFVLLEI